MKRVLKSGLVLFASLFMMGGAEASNGVDGWRAKWINTESCQSATNSWLIYRKSVELDGKPERLMARIAADSKYWMWINDRMVVFEGGLKRGPSPFSTYYDNIDIAPYLKSGKNTIAILLWHFGKDGFSHLNSGKAALLFEATAPGVEIISDNSWQCGVYDAYQNTEAPHPNYRMPESNIRFDARREIKDWNSSSFTGSLPGARVIANAGEVPFGELVERPIPMWKDSGLREYVSRRLSANGDTIFCRLPYNAQITPYIELEAEAGKLIDIRMDNYRGGSEPNVRAEYITRDGRQAYESLGWMNGHEVIYVIPKGVKVVDLRYRETGYNADIVGSFSCSDPFYDELWKRSARTLYITMRDNYMDCPDRERAQWWGDEVNELGEAFYALSLPGQKLAFKGIYELINWQREDGTLYSPVPSGNWAKELPLHMLASVGWYGFYTQYYYSGDSSFVADIYDRLHIYLHDVWRVDGEGLPIQRSGEWNWGDWGSNVDLGVLTSCWYYLALKAEREFALQLGKSGDAENIASMMRAVEGSFDKRFWMGSAYRTPGYMGKTDDRSQAMAVLSGLASKDKYPAIFKLLKSEYHASPYMEKYVLEALFKMDKADYALERMRNRYTKMLNYKEYTTLFEGWGIGAEGFGGGTINHAWSGGPLTMLSQQVCGVEPTSPGFRSFKVEPNLGTLEHASTSLETHYGTIKVSVKRSGNRLKIDVDVPEGTTAEVVWPNGKRQHLAAGKYTNL